VGSGVFVITAASALFVANARTASVAGTYVLPFVFNIWFEYMLLRRI